MLLGPVQALNRLRGQIAATFEVKFRGCLHLDKVAFSHEIHMKFLRLLIGFEFDRVWEESSMERSSSENRRKTMTVGKL